MEVFHLSALILILWTLCLGVSAQGTADLLGFASQEQRIRCLGVQCPPNNVCIIESALAKCVEFDFTSKADSNINRNRLSRPIPKRTTGFDNDSGNRNRLSRTHPFQQSANFQNAGLQIVQQQRPVNERSLDTVSRACLETPDPGNCLAYFVRFFFNPRTFQCEVFVYGGCGGNQNNFENIEDCNRACVPSQRKGQNSKSNLDQNRNVNKNRTERIVGTSANVGDKSSRDSNGNSNTNNNINSNNNNYNLNIGGSFDSLFTRSLLLNQPEQATPTNLFPNNGVPSVGHVSNGGLLTSGRRSALRSNQGILGNSAGGKFRGHRTNNGQGGSSTDRSGQFRIVFNSEERPNNIFSNQRQPSQNNDIIFRNPSQTTSANPLTNRNIRININEPTNLSQLQSGTSSVEGKHEGSAIGTVSLPHRACFFDADPGRCRARIPRHFFNRNTRRCEIFTYGGCGGNENNFGTLPDCRRACHSFDEYVSRLTNERQGNHFSPQLAPSTPSYNNNNNSNNNRYPDNNIFVTTNSPLRNNDRLQLTDETGAIGASTFSSKSNSKNGQHSRKPSTSGEEPSVSSNNFAPGAPPPPDRLCSLDADPGPCLSSITRYFYNVNAKRCENFNYGGCNGNANNFESLDKCERACNYFDDYVANQGNVDLSQTPGPLTNVFPATGLGNIPTFSGFEFSSIFGTSGPDIQFNRKPSSVSLDCNLDAKTGPCRAYINRYFFNKNTNQCEQFVYGGCQPNANNFRSVRDCQQACLGVRNESDARESNTNKGSGHGSSNSNNYNPLFQENGFLFLGDLINPGPFQDFLLNQRQRSNFSSG